MSCHKYQNLNVVFDNATFWHV